MNFETLQGRLIAQVNSRVRNGDLTERRLARMIGFSQPHTHNVLKGVRPLSPEMGDRILRNLNLCILDLCNAEELAAAGKKWRGAEHRVGPHGARTRRRG